MAESEDKVSGTIQISERAMELTLQSLTAAVRERKGIVDFWAAKTIQDNKEAYTHYLASSRKCLDDTQAALNEMQALFDRANSGAAVARSQNG